MNKENVLKPSGTGKGSMKISLACVTWTDETVMQANETPTVCIFFFVVVVVVVFFCFVLFFCNLALSEKILFVYQIVYYSYSSTKSRSPISPRGGAVTYGESSDSEGGGGEGRAWSTSSGRSEEGHSPRTSKKPSSASAFRKTAPQRIMRTASVDSSVSRALDRKALSGKVGASF